MAALSPQNWFKLIWKRCRLSLSAPAFVERAHGSTYCKSQIRYTWCKHQGLTQIFWSYLFRTYPHGSPLQGPLATRDKHCHEDVYQNAFTEGHKLSKLGLRHWLQIRSLQNLKHQKPYRQKSKFFNLGVVVWAHIEPYGPISDQIS